MVDCVQRHVLPHLATTLAVSSAAAGPPTCLDVGAGGCEIARRLAAAGFAVTAVEANADYFSGGGAGQSTTQLRQEGAEGPTTLQGPRSGGAGPGQGSGSLELVVGDFLDPGLGLAARQVGGLSCNRALPGDEPLPPLLSWLYSAACSPP